MPNVAIQGIAAAAILILGVLIGVWAAPGTDDLEARVAALQGQVEQQGKDAMAAAEAKAGELQGEIAALAARLDEQAAATTAANEATAAIKEQFASLENTLTETVGTLEAQVHDQVSGLESAIVAVKGDLAGVGDTLASLEAGSKMATATPAAYQTATAPAAEPMGAPASGVHRLGIGASAWAVEGLVSMSLSSIMGEDGARIFVNGQPVELRQGQAVRLRGLPAGAGTCTATLQGIDGGQADVAFDCAS